MNGVRKSDVTSQLKPRVSIGLPVYNGERYLEESIRSILHQSFTDFELIISDNASTDRTEAICREAAARDSRIRYYRSESNQGLAWNWNRVFELALGEYFLWSAHDDLFAPEFLKAAVEALDEDPSAVLCYAKERLIDEAGRVIRDYDSGLTRVGSSRLQDRFGDLVLIDHWCLPIYGLIRSGILRASGGYGKYVASDRVLLAELALYGRFREIPERLFMFRLHPSQSIQALAFHRRAAWINPVQAGRRVLPHWRFYTEYFRCLKRVRLTPRERLGCYAHLVRWWGVNWNWARMASDLMVAAVPGSLGLIQKIHEKIYGSEKY